VAGEIEVARMIFGELPGAMLDDSGLETDFTPCKFASMSHQSL